jgi:hypothetical protein
VGIVTRQQAGKSGLSIPIEAIDFLFLRIPIQSPIRWVLETPFSGIKWQKHEADQTPIFSAEVKNELGCTSIPLHTFMVCTGKTLCYTISISGRLMVSEVVT